MLRTLFYWFGFGGQAVVVGNHRHSQGAGEHGHTHGIVDPGIASSERGIWAVKWSFGVLLVTALLQFVVVIVSGSVALLADTIHNMGDATTAIPLWIAFALARRKPSKTFTYGLGRVEDLAGMVVVLIILVSAGVAFYEAVNRLFHPHLVQNLGWLAVAGVIGFLGNEIVAVFRIRVGRQMNSAALVADGYHARTDGLTSLAVVAGAAGVALGFPLADPIIGLLITVAILGIVWQSAGAVLRRALDGVEPEVIDEVRHAAEHVKGIERVVDAKARWIGHRLQVEAVVVVDDSILLGAANEIAASFRAELLEHIPALDGVTVSFALPDVAGAHHHSPKPVQVATVLADGLLEIVDTPEGERMRLRVSRHAEGLRARVEIARGDNTETLDLLPVGQNHHRLESRKAPAEPHEFTARLRLEAAGAVEELPFSMAEPAGHSHG